MTTSQRWYTWFRGSMIIPRWIVILNVLTLFFVFLTCLKTKDNPRTNLLLSSKKEKTNEECALFISPYHGPQYVSEGITIGKPKCLISSKWMQVNQHTLRLPGNEEVIVDDWLFIDYHDRINVLVEKQRSSTEERGDVQRQYLVFRQSKYALEGRESLAIIGGIIEPNESAKDAALREVQEEMGLHCKKLLFLGRYRTDVNRGMGWVNGFVAKDCESDTTVHADSVGQDEVGEQDSEQQDLISLSLEELKDAVRSGSFLEVQWSNTVALAMLHPELLL